MKTDAMKIVVCCPSYKRPKVETLAYLPFVRVYVDESEYDEYVKQNKGADIVRCPDWVQGNLCRVRNYILDSEFSNGADVVCIIDDDMKGMFRWERGKSVPVKAEDFQSFLYKYSVLAMDLGAYFWGVNLKKDKQYYLEYAPFSTVNYIGGAFQCFINDGGLRYDERLPLKEDYDMTIQQCDKFRKALRVNSYYYVVRQSEQAGGCATYRNYRAEEEQFKLLQRKWGKEIVKSDTSERCHKEGAKKKVRKRIDYNPVIHIPIKGV